MLAFRPSNFVDVIPLEDISLLAILLKFTCMHIFNVAFVKHGSF